MPHRKPSVDSENSPTSNRMCVLLITAALYNVGSFNPGPMGRVLHICTAPLGSGAPLSPHDPARCRLPEGRGERPCSPRGLPLDGRSISPETLDGSKVIPLLGPTNPPAPLAPVSSSPCYCKLTLMAKRLWPGLPSRGESGRARDAVDGRLDVWPESR